MNNTNNDLMWDCVTDILNRKSTFETITHVTKFITSYQENKGEEVDFNFSHDQWTAVLCWMHFFGYNKSLFPLFGHHMLHPIRAIQFLWMRFPHFLFFLHPFVILFSVLEATIFARKTDKGDLHTSGLLLDAYVIMSYNCYLWDIILTKIVELRSSWGSWENVYRVYHGNINHYNYKVYVAFMNSRND